MAGLLSCSQAKVASEKRTALPVRETWPSERGKPRAGPLRPTESNVEVHLPAMGLWRIAEVSKSSPLR